MKALLVFAALFCILPSCKKRVGTFEINGTLTNQSDDTKLDQCQLYLYSTPVGSGEQVLIDSTLTDSEGNYCFQFPREQVEKYKISYSKEGYFEGEEIVYFSSLTLEEPNIINLLTHGKSWAALRIINQTPSSSDHFRYVKQEGKTDCMDCCPAEEQNFYGALDTTIYCINNANDNYSILYWVIGTSNIDSRTVLTTFSDTSFIEISY